MSQRVQDPVVLSLVRRIAWARLHPAGFFDFVVKSEFGDRTKLTAAAHQRVLFDFVIHHDRSVIRTPPGFSKTFCMASLTMWLLGRYATARRAITSATREQAAKPLGMVRDYIEQAAEFPALRGEVYRLTCHGPDPTEAVPLWPAQFGQERLESIRTGFQHQPHVYAQLYRMRSFAAEGSRCKVEWIEAAKRAAMDAGVFGPVPVYRGPWVTFTGIDLGVGKTEQHDQTALLTFAVRDDGRRVILDADIGRFSAPDIVRKIQDKHERYGSFLRVETNAAQDYIRQFALNANIALPIRAHTTGSNKVDIRFGVESLFLELANGAWLIPCGSCGGMDPGIAKWVEECLSYRPPPAHTGDLLMASWLAREEARACGLGLTTPMYHRKDGGGLGGLMLR